jgi:hypothetical protein
LAGPVDSYNFLRRLRGSRTICRGDGAGRGAGNIHGRVFPRLGLWEQVAVEQLAQGRRPELEVHLHLLQAVQRLG